MDATTLLTEDHESVRELFDELEHVARTAVAERKALLGEIRRELEAHTRAEEDVFHPAVAKLQNDLVERLVAAAAEAHAAIQVLLEELQQLEPGDDDFEDLLAELRQDVEDHAEDDEEELFPIAREMLGPETLEALGKEIEAVQDSVRLAPVGH